jgi:hypothetical protein
MSIWSYPERGHWGNSKYRGNASGFVYRDLFQALKPQFVVDPCVGSGTSIEVARDMGIDSVGLDLHSGFNLLRDSILLATGRPADLVVSHFPYHNMVVYSGNMYPEVHADDLSRCASVEEFLEKSQQALLNQRDATRPGGHYATLIGDQRQNGKYYSYQAEFIARMPADELKGVIIKAQHNCVSDRRSYGAIASGMPRILHEYLLVWQRPEAPVTVLLTLKNLANQAQARLRSTWKSIVRQAMVSLGGEAQLKDLYEKIAGVAGDRIEANANWQAKVRQVLQKAGCFSQIERGRWALA